MSPQAQLEAARGVLSKHALGPLFQTSKLPLHLLLEHSVLPPAQKHAADSEAARKHQTLVDIINREIQVMRLLSGHPGVLQLHDVFETDHCVILVMEYAEGGELFKRIMSLITFSEKDACDIVTQLIDAIGYMHARGIAHRDIKPQNILLIDNEDLGIKLADFGLAKVLPARTDPQAEHYAYGEHEMLIQTACGTLLYAAPEIIRHKPYSLSVDMWSTGVLLFTMLAGEMPFDTVEELTAVNFKNKFNSPVWSFVTAEGKALVQQMLNVDPAQRPTPAEVLSHPWITAVRKAGAVVVPDRCVNLAELQTKQLAYKLARQEQHVAAQVALVLNIFDSVEVRSQPGYAPYELLLQKLDGAGYNHIILDPTCNPQSELVSGALYHMLISIAQGRQQSAAPPAQPSEAELIATPHEERDHWPRVVLREHVREQAHAYFAKVLGITKGRRHGISIATPEAQAPPASPRVRSSSATTPRLSRASQPAAKAPGGDAEASPSAQTAAVLGESSTSTSTGTNSSSSNSSCNAAATLHGPPGEAQAAQAAPVQAQAQTRVSSANLQAQTRVSSANLRFGDAVVLRRAPSANDAANTFNIPA